MAPKKQLQVSADRLDFRAPFISTRRSSSPTGLARMNSFSSIRTITGTEESPRVPFKWERSAGVPKESITGASNERQRVPFPPKPPPGHRRCHQRDEKQYEGRIQFGRRERYDDGNNGDIDRGRTNGEEDEEVDVFSDALDRLSFPEAPAPEIEYGLLNKPAGFCKNAELEPGITRAPSFIMRRFLPAASALANSSVATMPTTSNYTKRRLPLPPPSSHRCHVKEPTKFPPRKNLPPTVTEAERKLPPIKAKAPPQPMTPKACGLVLLSPWGLNNRLCGFRPLVQSKTPATVRARESLADVLRCDRNDRCYDFPRLDNKLLRKKCDNSLQNSSAFGWGLHFLDTSKLRVFGKTFERRKEKDSVDDENNTTRTGNAKWNLPPSYTPFDSLASQAVINFSGGK